MEVPFLLVIATRVVWGVQLLAQIAAAARQAQLPRVQQVMVETAAQGPEDKVAAVAAVAGKLPVRAVLAAQGAV